MENINKHWVIETVAEYRQDIINQHKIQLEKLGGDEYNMGKISKYLKECYKFHKIDEVYTEYRVVKLLRGDVELWELYIQMNYVLVGDKLFKDMLSVVICYGINCIGVILW